MKKKLISLIYKHKLDAVLITYWADLFYLTGLEKIYDYWLVINKTGKMKILVTEMIYLQLKNKLVNKNIEIIKVENLFKGLAKFIKTNRINSIGIDSEKMLCCSVEKLQDMIKTVKKIPGLLSQFRIIKSESEIKLVRKACSIISVLYYKIKSCIKPGMTEKYVHKLILDLFYEYNVEPAFDPIVASGPNSACPHHISSNRVIKQDDIILIDIGCKYKGYCSDLTRTFFFGKIKTYLLTIYNVVSDAQKQTVKKIKPGKKVSEIDKCTHNLIAEKGFKKYFIHSTGHGIGIEIHESPGINFKELNKDKISLKPGMIITIEPGIYVPEIGGVRIEDTILVTKTGYEVLTKA